MTRFKGCHGQLRWQQFWFGGLIVLLYLLAGCNNSPAVELVESSPATPLPAVEAAPREAAAVALVAKSTEIKPEQREPETARQQPPVSEPMAEGEAATDAVQPAEPPPAGLPVETTEAAVEQAPPPRRPLDRFIATDPATVSLASGRVQLVEFFAEW
jgi:hypothetical protein